MSSKSSAAAGWAALALVGHACSLQLIEVSRAANLEHIYAWGKLIEPPRVFFLALILVQAGIVFLGARKQWRALERSFPLSGMEGLALLGLFGFAATVIAPNVGEGYFRGGWPLGITTYATKVLLALFIMGVNGLNLALAAAAIPDETWKRIALRWREIRGAQLAWACALFVLVTASVLAWVVFDRLPHVPDEVAYLFHAKYFAAGHVYLPEPPEPKAFACSLVFLHAGKWYSAQLPGWPFVLALGVWAGVPWLVNPLLGAIAILISYAFVRKLYDEPLAKGVVLLLAFSPWLLYMSANLMGHALSLVLSMAGFLAVQRARESGSLGWAALAGACLGGLANTRPLEALALGIVVGLWWLSAGWKRLRIAAVATSMLVAMSVVGLQLAYNQAVTNNPWELPFEKMLDEVTYKGANRVGFGPDVGNLGWLHLDPLPGHGPLDVVLNTNQNIYMVNFEMFGWACGSLLFVFLLLAARRFQQDLLMWGTVLAIWAAMSCYWFSGGPDFGARYWYQMIVPLVLLSLRGVQHFGERWATAAGSASPTGASRVWAFVALATLMGFVNLLPWRATSKYKNYRRVSDDVRELAKQHNFGRSLVFVRGEEILLPWNSSFYASAFSLNPPTLDRNAPGTIYARDLGPESRERLRKHYSDRPVWILADPVITGGGFRILEGPLPPQNRAPANGTPGDTQDKR